MNTKFIDGKQPSDRKTEAVEALLHGKLGGGSAPPEPDYDAMWMKMKLELERGGAAGAPGRESANRAPARMRVRKVAMVTALGAALAAVPAYAAFQYDWSDILAGREGIQTALAQGLGQSIEQSVTHDGVTLTLHTAFADAGRTVILYSLDPGCKQGSSFDFSRLLINDASGQSHEVSEMQQLNESGGTLAGYFETDWSPSGSSESVQLHLEGLHFYEGTERELNFDAADPQPQTVEIGQDGIDRLALQPFVREDGSTMIRTAVSANASGQAGSRFTQLRVYDANGKPIPASQPGAYGAPGENGSKINEEYYDTSALAQGGLTYKLAYQRAVDKVADSWNFPLVLDKSELRHASSEQKLNVSLGEGEDALKLSKLSITPTQIRLEVREPDGPSPSFNRYELIVDGKRIDKELNSWAIRGESGYNLVLERPADLALSPDSTIVLSAKHEVVPHEGDLPAPVRLANIGARKQSLVANVGGFPVKWTYYKQGGDLYVQTSSTDPNFGGIAQTYMGSGRGKVYGTPMIQRMQDEGGERLDAYKNFTGDSAELQIFYYIEHLPDKEVRVQVYPGK
ncbi:DUF4179 domain-containing protein [Saccharibacillus sp. CPCC 101409]|uniref:DUF4179 domain-containing protein n=1 Tax=Saccharibacillus sp. CPCC 101409 TaxID=3058041 RepID=UPI0026733EF9|nr:DUF4179 domain-containing protein [Saccharibacillus sp. CPCC 101409]MDO3409304.1 DUF4179 domain-containing protein [Saccharibacillus sp. CPCC 101409]